MKSFQKICTAVAALASIGGAVAFTPKPFTFSNKVQAHFNTSTSKYTYQNRVAGGFGSCAAVTPAISCTFSSTKTAAFFTPALGYDVAYPPVNTTNTSIPMVNYPTTDQQVYK